MELIELVEPIALVCPPQLAKQLIGPYSTQSPPKAAQVLLKDLS